MVPWGVRKVLNWVKSHYSNIPIHVTISAFEPTGTRNDTDRVEFIRDYANEVLKGRFRSKPQMCRVQCHLDIP